MSAKPTEAIHPENFTIDPKQEMTNFCYSFALPNLILLKNLRAQDQLFDQALGVHYPLSDLAVIAIKQLQQQLKVIIIKFDHDSWVTTEPVTILAEADRLIAVAERYLAIFTTTT